MPLPTVLDELDRLFDELIRRPWGGAARRLVPAQIRETEGGWGIELPVPHMRAGDLTIQVRGRQVSISGFRRTDRERKRGPGTWAEVRQETAFHQIVTLPAEVPPENITAEVNGTTLTIHVRKPQ